MVGKGTDCVGDEGVRFKLLSEKVEVKTDDSRGAYAEFKVVPETDDDTEAVMGVIANAIIASNLRNPQGTNGDHVKLSFGPVTYELTPLLRKRGSLVKVSVGEYSGPLLSYTDDVHRKINVEHDAKRLVGIIRNAKE